ncbi:MAG: polyisoprenoid-binding protein YceI [Myxococcota bacterium]|jgi:polyisoprenoid-binding protein YceI
MFLILAALGCTGEPEPATAPVTDPAIPAPGAPGAAPGGPGGPGTPGAPGAAPGAPGAAPGAPGAAPAGPESNTNNGPPPSTKGTVSGGELKLIQVKNGSAEVGATLTGVTGSLDFLSGEAASGELKFDVSTWASGDAGRDVNVRGTFFKATAHPEATFTLESMEGLPDKPLLLNTEAMAVAKGTLALYAGSVPVTANVKLARGPDGYTLQTTEDFTVSIAGLGMSDNLTELIKICAHDSVDDSVRIGLNLTLSTD